MIETKRVQKILVGERLEFLWQLTDDFFGPKKTSLALVSCC